MSMPLRSVFFFKQKTAYEMRISDWSSDVCSSDLFENCYPNTLDTTVQAGTLDGRPDTFVITGDIEAMWLRDSSAQVQPYIHLVAKDPKLKRLLQGLIQRQARCILLRSEEHTSEPQSLMSSSYAVFCLKKKISCLI